MKLLQNIDSQNAHLQSYIDRLHRPAEDSHKGDNGKLMIIGGSELFHAASRWSLDVASKFVDMVFYSSIPINNQLIREAKKEFWNGIVVPRKHLHDYMDEADAILIGPGMTRDVHTESLTNDLLRQYPEKKWVVDAGALQMVDPLLLAGEVIITPHSRELERLAKKNGGSKEELLKRGVTILLKGELDQVFSYQIENEANVEEIHGGNPGMTKGGTGDVLAGVVAGLYATNEAVVSAVVGSLMNKQAGDRLYEEMGVYFNASELVQEV